jgi:hypothetical protein
MIDPFSEPWIPIASIAYREQVGAYRQVGGAQDVRSW